MLYDYNTETDSGVSFIYCEGNSLKSKLFEVLQLDLSLLILNAQAFLYFMILCGHN